MQAVARATVYAGTGRKTIRPPESGLTADWGMGETLRAGKSGTGPKFLGVRFFVPALSRVQSGHDGPAHTTGLQAKRPPQQKSFCASHGCAP